MERHDPFTRSKPEENLTMTAWTSTELRHIGAARELQIASMRADGTLRPWVPVWVVCAAEHIYVRTWYRRKTGWFGHVLDSRRAGIRVPGLEAGVTVEDIGEGTDVLRAGIDAAYRAKYGPGDGTSRMVADAAAAATLRLSPAPEPPAQGRRFAPEDLEDIKRSSRSRSTGTVPASVTRLTARRTGRATKASPSTPWAITRPGSKTLAGAASRR
jgi:hypothetical protein